MRIGFVGAGKIGAALARHFVALDHDVLVSNSRGPDTLAELVAELGPLASAGTTEEAIAFGDVVVITIPLVAVAGIPPEGLVGKTVIDTCNYYPQRDGQFPAIDDGTKTESEVVAEHFAGADVVKAFNSIMWKHLADDVRPAGSPERRAIPIAGDNATAKLTVSQLIDQIGFDPVDAGPLSAGLRFQNGGDLYGAELTAAELSKALAN